MHIKFICAYPSKGQTCIISYCTGLLNFLIIVIKHSFMKTLCSCRTFGLMVHQGEPSWDMEDDTDGHEHGHFQGKREHVRQPAGTLMCHIDILPQKPTLATAGRGLTKGSTGTASISVSTECPQEPLNASLPPTTQSITPPSNVDSSPT